MHNYFYFFDPYTHSVLIVALSEKKQAPFSMAIGNVELAQECFLKQKLKRQGPNCRIVLIQLIPACKSFQQYCIL